MSIETFQQPKIPGYRQLSEREAALMSEGKQLGIAIGEWIAKLRENPNITQFPQASPGDTDLEGRPYLDHRWIAIGVTDIQKGLMCVIRGIAQPTTF